MPSYLKRPSPFQLGPAIAKFARYAPRVFPGYVSRTAATVGPLAAYAYNRLPSRKPVGSRARRSYRRRRYPRRRRALRGSDNPSRIQKGGVSTYDRRRVLTAYRTKRPYRKPFIKKLKTKLDRSVIPWCVSIKAFSTDAVIATSMKNRFKCVLLMNQASIAALFTDITAITSSRPNLNTNTEGSQEIYQKTAAYIKNITYDLTLTQNSEALSTNTIVDVYWLKAKKDADTNASPNIVEATDDGRELHNFYGRRIDTSTLTVGGSSGVKPYNVGSITNDWWIGRHEQLSFVNGSNFTFNGVLPVYKKVTEEHLNKITDGTADPNGYYHMKDVSNTILVCVRDGEYTVGDGTKSNIKIGISYQVRWKPTFYNQDDYTGPTYSSI